MKKLKLKITHYVRKIIYTYFNHYAWPRRLANRMFDYNIYYKNELLVNLGAGPYFKRKGWISADFLPEHDALENCIALDINRSLDKLPFNNVKAFYMSHMLEHFHIDDGERILKSIYSALEPGGYLRVVVPDADLILNMAKIEDKEYFRPFFNYFKNINEEKITSIDIALHLCSQPRCRYQQLEFESRELNEFEKKFLNQNNDTIISILNDHSFKNNSTGTLHLAAYNTKILIEKMQAIGFKNVYRSAFMQSRFGPMREAPIFDGTHPWMSLYVEAIK